MNAITCSLMVSYSKSYTSNNLISEANAALLLTTVHVISYSTD